MSQENVELVRECFALFNEQGMEIAIEAFGHLLDESFGIDEAAEVPDRERHSGKQGFVDNSPNSATSSTSFVSIRWSSSTSMTSWSSWSRCLAVVAQAPRL